MFPPKLAHLSVRARILDPQIPDADAPGPPGTQALPFRSGEADRGSAPTEIRSKVVALGRERITKHNPVQTAFDIFRGNTGIDK
jgi:hypothetical protein